MGTTNKIVALPALKRKLAPLRKRKSIAFTNGCFDILHAGHVSYLEKAKKDGRILVIGLNSDASVRKLKGPNRPIVSQKNRATILAALQCVDFVVIFQEETPIKLIESIRPDVLIKGADWKGKPIAGDNFVKAHGGKVEFIRLVPDSSTTNIIQSVLNKCAG